MPMPYGIRPQTPYQETHDRFTWKWIHLENPKTVMSSMEITLPLDSKDSQHLPLMLQAVKDGAKDLIKQLIANDTESVNTDDSLGRTAVMYAVHFKQMECLKFLLSKKADVNRTANDGSTAVHRAIIDNTIPAVELLIQYNADVTIQDSQGRAPVHWATTAEDVDCLEILLKCNVNVNVRDIDGLTPSMWACHMDHKVHFELINSASIQVIEEADGIERDYNGKTWVHWAVRRTEPLTCLRSLLNPETATIKDHDGKNVIHTAADIGSLDACKLIIEVAGKQCLELKDDEERTCLHIATVGGHGELVNFLMEHGANQFERDCHNALPMDYAQARRLHYCALVFAAYQRQHERKMKRSMAMDDEMEQERTPLPSYSGSSPSPPPGLPRPPSGRRDEKRRSSGGALQSQAKRGPSAQKVKYSDEEENEEGNEVHQQKDYEADEEDETHVVQNRMRSDEPMVNNTPNHHEEYNHDAEMEEEESPRNDNVFDVHRTEIVQSLDGMDIEDLTPSHENPDINVIDHEGDVVDVPEETVDVDQERVNSFGSEVSDKSLSVGMSVSDIEGDGREEEKDQRQHEPIPLQPQGQRSPPFQQKMTPRPPGPQRIFIPRPPAPVPGSSPNPVNIVTPAPPPPVPHYSQNPPQHSPSHQEYQYYDNQQQPQTQETTERPLQSGTFSGQHMPPHGHGEMQPSPLQHSIPRQLAPLQQLPVKKKKKKKKHHSSSSIGSSGDGPLTARGAPTAPLEPVQGHGIGPPSQQPNGPVSPRSHNAQPFHQSPTDNPHRISNKGPAWEVAWEPVRPQAPVPPLTPRDDERDEPQFLQQQPAPQQQQQQQQHRPMPNQPQPMPRGKKGNKLQGMENELVQMESTNINGYMEEGEEEDEPVEQRRTLGRAVIDGPNPKVGKSQSARNPRPKLLGSLAKEPGRALMNGQEMPVIRRDVKGMTQPRPKTHTYSPQRYRSASHHPVPAPRPPRT
uniref:Neurogenic locus notch homolog protein 1-like n=1 Tax=Saccoglossus kowalevskii TaxID=10224 RepID=A0ABM0M720_SACKO|nr:PREDICTED: neurogenic locus notch homolog protein 1-like [Saccoglossus kowalevskii]